MFQIDLNSDLTLFRMGVGAKIPPPPIIFSLVTFTNVGTSPPKISDFYF